MNKYIETNTNISNILIEVAQMLLRLNSKVVLISKLHVTFNYMIQLLFRQLDLLMKFIKISIWVS